MQAVSQKQVITISRQMGCLGYAVAQAAADALGYRLVGREVINRAAARSSTPEAALAAIDELGLLGACPSPAACRAYRKAVEQVITELAEEGRVVIVGRAGQVILGNFPQALHVRIFAPAESRVARVAARLNISLANAQAQIEASDLYRRRYLRRFYHVRWDNPDLYDLIINTESVSVQSAARLICCAATGELDAHPREDSD